MSHILVDWFAEDRKATRFTLGLLTSEAILDHTLECPILLQPFPTAEMPEMPGIQYRLETREYCMAILPCCQQPVHPIALAVHWLLHRMRCPFCNQGCDHPLSPIHLPDSCRQALVTHTTRIRKEINEDTSNSDLQNIMDSMDEDSVDGNFAVELILLRQWDYVQPRMQLQVTLHVPVASVDAVLESINRDNARQCVWNPCPYGIGIFCPLNETMLDETVSQLTTQMNHVRRISKALHTVQPARMSLSLCYSSSAFIWQVARVSTFDLSDSLEPIQQPIYYTHQDQRMEIGNATLTWINDGKGPMVQPHQKSIDRISISISTTALMDRLVYGHMCLYNLRETEEVELGLQSRIMRFPMPNV